MIQEWQGVIQAYNKETGMYIARLKDITAGGTDEELRAHISDFSEEDQKIINDSKWGGIGHVFTMKIDTEKDPALEIELIKLPPWTEEQIKQAEERAKRLYDGIRWE